LPNNEPINIKINIMVEDKILKCIPSIDPKTKNIIINNVLPNPIPKCDPTNAMYVEE
tara:strand:+ start:972 stop:1142 length:171 start_codon:yes stop_codon:yes gene_type:complete